MHCRETHNTQYTKHKSEYTESEITKRGYMCRDLHSFSASQYYLLSSSSLTKLALHNSVKHRRKCGQHTHIKYVCSKDKNTIVEYILELNNTWLWKKTRIFIIRMSYSLCPLNIIQAQGYLIELTRRIPANNNT